MKWLKLVKAILLFAVLAGITAMAMFGINHICDEHTQPKQEHIEKGCKGWHWLTRDAAGFFTFALSIITGFLAYYTYGLYSTTIELARGADKAANRQFRHAEDTARQQLRAYVVIDDCSAIGTTENGSKVGAEWRALVRGSFPVAFIAYKNTGQTPAYDVRIDAEAELMPWPLDEAKLVSQPTNAGSQAVLGHTGSREGRVRELSWGALNQDQMNALIGGQTAFVTWGVVTYRDIFGQQWETNFRYFTGGARSFTPGDKGMSAHDRGNEAT